MPALRAFRFSNVKVLKFWPAHHSLDFRDDLYDNIEIIITAIVRSYGCESDSAAWERLKRLELFRFDHIRGQFKWHIITDESQVAKVLQEAPFARYKPRLVELTDDRRLWVQRENVPYTIHLMQGSWPWFDKAGEALRRMNAEAVEDL